MIKVINQVFSILKLILLIVSFVFTFYIVMAMYQRLGKNIFESISIFIPYFVLLLLFCLNYILKQTQVTKSLFYNLTCCLVFLVFIFVSYRTINDSFMLMQRRSNYHMSFHYFSDMIAPLTSMLYLLAVGNLCLIFSKEKEEEKVITKKEERKEISSPKKEVVKKKSGKSTKK